MNFGSKHFLALALFGALVANWGAVAPLVSAQDDPNAEAPASEPAPAPEAAPAPTPAPAPEAAPTPNPAAVLDMERAAKTKTPEIFEKLTFDKTFSRRIPNYWNALKLTKRQKNAIYALQEEYFAEIIQLQARVARLEAERDARYREVLTQKQRETLDAKLAEVEKSRAAKAEAKEAAEEAEAEAAIN